MNNSQKIGEVVKTHAKAMSDMKKAIRQMVRTEAKTRQIWIQVISSSAAGKTISGIPITRVILAMPPVRHPRK